MANAELSHARGEELLPELVPLRQCLTELELASDVRHSGHRSSSMRWSRRRSSWWPMHCTWTTWWYTRSWPTIPGVVTYAPGAAWPGHTPPDEVE